MNMSTRIRRAWDALLDRTSGMPLDSPTFLEAARVWMQTAVPAVSVKAAAALEHARGVQLLLAGRFATLPLRRCVASDLLQTAKNDTTPDPERFVAIVNRFAWALAVYSDDDDTCPRCQGDLEMWSTPVGEIVFRCDLLGCTFDATEAPIEASNLLLGPATRQQVLALHPGADLLGGDCSMG